MTKEYAVYLHRRMWMDMQRDLGNNPYLSERADYKKKWCKEHFPHKRIDNNCFLCEYIRDKDGSCEEICPIVWTGGDCMASKSYYNTMPISELLAQPMRKDN